MKVAIVCDWLVGTGGAERVVLELHHMFPEAPIYTSKYHRNPNIWYGDKWFEDADVRVGWLQKLPLFLRKFSPLLRILYFSRLNLDGYDLVISSSGAEAKGIKVKPSTKHVSYIHSPTHYYWTRYEEYLENPGFGRLNWLARVGLKLLVGPLRRWDYRAAQRPDLIITNSTHTQKMVRQYYGRESTVVHPPVDVERFNIKPDELRRGFVIAGRQVPYKRIDLAVRACSELKLPLVVIGNGPDHRRLKRLAGRSVTFLKNVSDEKIIHYFNSSSAFIFPGLDDFGIVAVEALAAGTPVIAYKAGGALDYIEPGKNGEFFNEQTAESLARTLRGFKPEKFDNSEIQKYARQFSSAAFRDKLNKLLDSIEK